MPLAFATRILRAAAEMGIGGLDAQFKEIFRRAFASRLVPPDIMKKMGQVRPHGYIHDG